MHIGEIIHRLRKEKKMTLLELSRKSGVALASLSRIENGKMAGTLRAHGRIAEALETSLPDIYRELIVAEKQPEIQPKDDRKDVDFLDKSLSIEMLVSNVARKKMSPSLIRIAQGKATPNEQAKPGCEKFVYVLEGKVAVHIGQRVFAVGRADTLYFEASIAHAFQNTGNGEARIIVVTCPPQI